METILIAIITGVIGSYLTYYFTSKARREEAIIKYKEEKYIQLLIKLQGFVGLTSNAETKREFFNEQYQSWLYSSDDVVESINKLVDLVKEHKGTTPDPTLGQKTIGNIVLAMRKDLLGKTNLTYKAFTYTDVHE